MEFFKWLTNMGDASGDDWGLQPLLNIMNSVWRGEFLLGDLELAEVVLLFKKGKTELPENQSRDFC